MSAGTRRASWPTVPEGSDLATLLRALRDAGCVYGGSIKGGRGGAFTCPLHGDANPSLDVEIGKIKPFILNCKPCYASGDFGDSRSFYDALMEALGRPRFSGRRVPNTEVDWGAPYRGRSGPHDSSRKQKYLQSWWHAVESYDYFGEPTQANRQGDLPDFRVIKYECCDPANPEVRLDKTFRAIPIGIADAQRKIPPQYRVPYRYEDREQWRGAWVAITEGEKDADRLRAAGHLATTFVFGDLPRGFEEAGEAVTTADLLKRHFAGVRGIRLYGDFDKVGVAKVRERMKALRAASIKVQARFVDPARLESVGVSARKADVSDWLDADLPLDDMVPLSVVEGLIADAPALGHETVPTDSGAAELDAPFDSWIPVDVVSLLDGTVQRPEPTKGRRIDGAFLFYAAHLNVIFGDPESGKTWVALAVLAEAMLRGETVGFIDYEDAVGSALARLRQLGVADRVIGSLLRYVNPERVDRDGVLRFSAGCSVVVIDATTEAMSAEGLNDNASVEVAAFYAMLPKLIAKTGACVILIDHVTKASEGKNQQAGSQHKRAGIDGVSVKVESVTPFVPGGEGMSRLIVTKDRQGAVREKSPRIASSRNAQYADFRLLADGGWSFDMPSSVKARTTKDPEAARNQLKFSITRVANQSAAAPLRTVRGVQAALKKDGVRFTKETMSKSLLDELVDEGYLRADYSFIRFFMPIDVDDGDDQ